MADCAHGCRRRPRSRRDPEGSGVAVTAGRRRGIRADAVPVVGGRLAPAAAEPVACADAARRHALRAAAVESVPSSQHLLDVTARRGGRGSAGADAAPRPALAGSARRAARAPGGVGAELLRARRWARCSRRHGGFARGAVLRRDARWRGHGGAVRAAGIRSVLGSQRGACGAGGRAVGAAVRELDHHGDRRVHDARRVPAGRRDRAALAAGGDRRARTRVGAGCAPRRGSSCGWWRC